MYRILAVLFIFINCVLSAATALAQNPGGAPKSGPVVNRICVYDGLKYKTLESAMSACGENGLAVIPPTYAGQDPANANNPLVWDFRRPERLKAFTQVTDFGVKGDAVAGVNGTSESGSATFTATSASFVKGDAGKAIVITGAGAENGTLTTTIKSVEGPDRVTLTAPAAFTGKGLTYWYGTENTAVFQKAYESRKPLFLPAGKYLMTGTVKGSTPLLLAGAGAQSIIIDDRTVFSVHGTQGHFLDNFRLQAATKLTVLRPASFPTPHPGTPVSVDRNGAGIGYQPQNGDGDIWPKLSKQQQAQQIGPFLELSSDGIHVYRITGDLLGIVLFDSQYSEVAQCDFRGGKNFVGGIALWHTPKDGAMNRHDSIHNNTVRYASFSGIAWAASEDVSVRNNVVEYSGESGFKNYSSQGDGTYDSQIELIGNHSQGNHYDGLDLSESYPHTNSQKTSSVVSNNVSSFNDRTGVFGDGIGWKLTNNVIENNGLTGISLDVSESVISGNTLKHNNRLHDPAAHQILLGPGAASRNNVIEHNRIEAETAAGAAIKWSAASTGNRIDDNIATGGALFKFDAPPAASHTNSDGRGRYPDR